jgi:PqqD family protein of HPr-rel-A system
MKNLQRKIIRTADILSSPVHEELVMFDVEAGKYYALNGMAATIWQALETPATFEEICAGLLESFDAAPEQCRREVLAFLSKLEEKGLIREAL